MLLKNRRKRTSLQQGAVGISAGSSRQGKGLLPGVRRRC
jgi:hypothetical protein